MTDADDDNYATPAELAEMLGNQGSASTMEVYPTMEAAWQDVVEQDLQGAPPKVLQDAKWIFFRGLREAANLLIFCAGHGQFEVGVDQLRKELTAYDEEAKTMAQQRRLLELGDGLDVTSH